MYSSRKLSWFSAQDGREIPIDSRDQQRFRSRSVVLVDVKVCSRFTRVLESAEEVCNVPDRRAPSFDASAVGPRPQIN